MLRRRIVRAVLAALGSFLLCTTSRAGVSPQQSSVEPIIVGGSSGDYYPWSDGFDVVIRDVNHTPIPGAVVTVDFGGTSVAMYSQQASGITLDCATRTVTKITNASGAAKFVLRFGGSATIQSIPVSSTFSGWLANVKAYSTDLDAVGATTGLSDFAIFAAAFGAVQPHPSTNFNLSVSDVPDLGDFNAFSSEFARAISAGYCP